MEVKVLEAYKPLEFVFNAKEAKLLQWVFVEQIRTWKLAFDGRNHEIMSFMYGFLFPALSNALYDEVAKYVVTISSAEQSKHFKRIVRMSKDWLEGSLEQEHVYEMLENILIILTPEVVKKDEVKAGWRLRNEPWSEAPDTHRIVGIVVPNEDCLIHENVFDLIKRA